MQIQVDSRIKETEKVMIQLLSTGFFGHRLMPLEV